MTSLTGNDIKEGLADLLNENPEYLKSFGNWIIENGEDLLKRVEQTRQSECEAARIVELLSNGTINDFRKMESVSGMALLMVCANLDSESKKQAEQLLSDNGKNANKGRVDKYENIKNALKPYWLANIDPAMKAPAAAILLERTDIYNQSDTKPKRSMLERYVRKWQRLPK